MNKKGNMASDKTLAPNKVFSGDAVGKLIHSVDDESKLVFENADAEYSLAMFLLVRRAFNDAYEKVKETIVDSGVGELGNSFSGLTGSLIRGTHAERGGSKYQWLSTPGEDIDPEFLTKQTVYKIDSKAVDKHLKKFGELPPGIELARRNKSLSLQPTKEAKALFEQKQDQDSMLYDLEVREIEDGEDI